MLETTDPCMDLSLGVAVADWVRNAAMLTVAAVWAVFVVVSLARGHDVDPVVWGVVPAASFALNPTLKKGTKDGPS